MTKQEYEKLVKGTYSFANFTPEKQKQVLAAEGEEMEKYIEMFQQENSYLQSAIGTLKNETDAIVVGFKVGQQKKQKKILLGKERKSRKMELQRADDLLKKI